ncbi:MAG: O-antigen ligase family protein [Terriglobia bacterium]
MSSPSEETINIPVFMETSDAEKVAGSRWRTKVGVLLLVTLMLAPLAFGAVQTWAWASLAVIAVLLLFLWGIGCVQERAVRVFWSPLYLPAGLFLLLGVIQYLGHLTVDPVGTREALLKLVTDLIFFFLAGQLWAIASEGAIRALGLTVIIYAFLLSLVAILQFFSGPDFDYWNYWKIHSEYGAVGPYVNPDHYAGLMEMLIPLSATYVLSLRKGHQQPRLLGFAVVLPIASALLTGSRGGFISLLAEIVILGAVLLKSSSVSGRRNLLTIGALGITATAILFFWIDPGQMSKRLGKIFDFKNSIEASYGHRGMVALDTLNILRDHPLIGTGLGSFETAYPPYQSLPGDAIWTHAHNDYVEALSESGLIGGLLIYVALLLFFPLAFRSLGMRLGQPGGWLQLGATIGCCGLLIHSFVDFNLRIPANAAWFALCAGIALTAAVHPTRGRKLRAGLLN